MNRTIMDRFDPRANSLNAIRLILALLVIVAHSWPIGGWGAAPEWFGRDLGNTAVAGFFALSGYLITASRLSSSSVKDYFWRRALRIYPAYITVLVLVALVAAPLSLAIGGGGPYSWWAGARYIAGNITLYVNQWGIRGTLTDAPYPSVWNGSIWTLWFEAMCYVAIGVGVSLVSRRLLVPCVSAWLVLAGSYTIAHEATGFEVHAMLTFFSMVSVYFAAGSILFLLRARIPLTATWAAAASVVTVGAVVTGVFPLLGALPFAYLMMYLGVTLPLRKIGRRNDFSYGVYIYAMPIQQLLVVAVDWTRFPIGVYVATSVAATAPFAVASWFLVEKPAMLLKRLTAPAKRDIDRLDAPVSSETS
ncbi:acyltransferase [Rhodococcus kroppenstedtii]|uniref:acyltransferase family protein n=1 Tax=Rhodococcoides kroppenstedtii TaxID=293050 RepID=UPI001C9B1F1A|nr:acyltransferase [Rhodococcus kroppenstedtii]MBY6437553.1 acyltransferase [Rhodococcus kroppenstedtii]